MAAFKYIYDKLGETYSVLLENQYNEDITNSIDEIRRSKGYDPVTKQEKSGENGILFLFELTIAVVLFALWIYAWILIFKYYHKLESWEFILMIVFQIFGIGFIPIIYIKIKVQDHPSKGDKLFV